MARKGRKRNDEEGGRKGKTNTGKWKRNEREGNVKKVKEQEGKGRTNA